MTPEERDSLLKISPISDGDTLDITKMRKEGLAQTTGDVFDLFQQDAALKKGKPINLTILDSLFIESSKPDFNHRFLTYDQNKVLTDSIGNLDNNNPVYSSELYPLGSQSLQYLQIKADIPMSDFIKQQILTLSLSASLMLIVLLCLYIQLVGIKKRTDLLLKREASVNGTIHDLKAPLNSIITMLSWFKMSEMNPDKKKVIENSQMGVKHLVYNIESLLISAREDRQKIILNKTKVNIPAIVETIKEELDLLYQGKSHTIEMINELSADNTVFADSMYIENVIRNLIENSLKYSDDNVIVKVVMSATNNKLQVSVKDNGWGIEPQHRKKLFTQFYQVPRNEEQTQKGHGIGLAQARYIITEHGGEIKMTSGENSKGCVFTFTLPLS
ncbi:sensor histidine kinase [Parabacteroides timonensis]|uniref:sensor histidine kinase n=1 Tax=Parabacteroides timonensis TaxID=1871013 RepID=UPI000B24AA6D|nr:HAMP domain-containing sensor histidine kinase [Parabacteroides timonensis]